MSEDQNEACLNEEMIYLVHHDTHHGRRGGAGAVGIA